MNNTQNFTKGFFKENAVFVQLLGMCPTLGVTTSAINGLGMGLATTFVLVMSNLAISLIKGFIPDKVRIPAFIVVIATFVTIVDLAMAGYLPDLHEQLGLFIPLIVVNCIVLGRAEAFASKNTVLPSIIDGLGMGLGFSMALLMLGSIREILGSLSIFGIHLGIHLTNIVGSLRIFRHFDVQSLATADGILLFIMPPGAFLALGFLIALINYLRKKLA